MVYGIDLGTTYSAIAECDENGNVKIVGNATDSESLVTASVVHFDEETGVPTVGNVAKRNLGNVGYAEQTLHSFKLQMGESYCKETIVFEGKNRQVSPIEGSACILHYLIHFANLQRKSPINRAVITIPVSFTYEQRACTRKAAELAGIEVVGLLHEPTAAAIAYGIQVNETVLVFDLGGGTLDVSIVKCIKDKNGNDKFEVLGIASDSDVLGQGKHLGGQDWDEELIKYALRFLPQIDRTNRYKDGRLKIIAEDCKKQLSSIGSKVKTQFRYNDDFKEIQKKDFENISMGLVYNCCQVVEKAIEDALNKVVSMNESLTIDRFILTGGSSNMPMIRRELLDRFHDKYSNGRSDEEWLMLYAPEQAIAKGAAKYAYLVETGKMVDVIEEKSPYSYGTMIGTPESGLKIENLILKSDPMIIKNKEYSFKTVSENQQTILVDIYENKSGDHKFAFIVGDSNCRRISESDIFTIGERRPKGTQIKFVVSRDKDGLIGIEASCGDKKEYYSYETNKSRIPLEIENQIIHSINLMDQE